MFLILEFLNIKISTVSSSGTLHRRLLFTKHEFCKPRNIPELLLPDEMNVLMPNKDDIQPNTY